MSLVLGLESSCDDTGVAIYDNTQKTLTVNMLASQAKIHEPWGGVVPELAARNHISTMIPLIHHSLQSKGHAPQDLDLIAYTKGPGLIGSLMVGAAVANGLAYALDIPAIGMHHMEAHMMAAMLESEKPSFPFLTLLVSGGHTMLLDARGIGQYRILGSTLDDAVGEAFDKTAKMLDLGYPGGPQIEKHARNGSAMRFNFPRPMAKSSCLNFSFSGLKTAVRRAIEKQTTINEETLYDLCASFQAAAFDALIIKCNKAIRQSKRKSLVIAGGVGANHALREMLRAELPQSVRLYYPRAEFCVDNGAMIAHLGALRAQPHTGPKNYDFTVYPKWSLESLNPIA